jgi:hypothetical protein
VRPAQARDYRRHIEGYVLPHLGNVPIPTLLPRDLTALQDVLLNQPISGYGLARLQMGREALAQRNAEIATAKKRRRGGKYVVEEADADGVPRLSTKYVRNIIIGSFRAMLRDAAGIDRIPLQLSLPELCVGLKSGWGHEDEHEPDPDPFAPEERDAILESSSSSFCCAPYRAVHLRDDSVAEAVLHQGHVLLARRHARREPVVAGAADGRRLGDPQEALCEVHPRSGSGPVRGDDGG